MRFLGLHSAFRGTRASAHRRVFTLLAAFLMPEVARAQQAPPVPQNDRDTVQELLKRMEGLEARIKELEAERAKPAAPAPVAPVPQEETPAPEAQMRMPSGPNLHIRGFTDVNFQGGNQKNTTTAFNLGQLNLFVTSELSDRFKFLSEIVFEAAPDNAFGAEVERLLLQYVPSDYLNISIGRYHTAIGYYNTAYHHSTWLQTATRRPFLFDFEDKGGILPIHNVGVSATGRIPSGRLGLHYVAEVGNGRASRSPLSEPVQNVSDENNRKAVNFGVFARPEAIRGLQTGFSVYRDMLTPVGSPKIGETILAAHVVFVQPGFEWLNEALLIRHAPIGLAQVFRTPGFYTQISRRFGSYRPYFRYQYVNAPVNEPIFPDAGLRHGPSAGLRFDATDFVALKLQYDRTMLRRQRSIDALTLQFSLAF